MAHDITVQGGKMNGFVLLAVLIGLLARYLFYINKERSNALLLHGRVHLTTEERRWRKARGFAGLLLLIASFAIFTEAAGAGVFYLTLAFVLSAEFIIGYGWAMLVGVTAAAAYVLLTHKFAAPHEGNWVLLTLILASLLGGTILIRSKQLRDQ